MSSVRARSARPGAVEEDPRRVEDHRQAQQQREDVVAQPERRRRRSNPSTSRPIGDHSRIGIESTRRDEEPVAHVARPSPSIDIAAVAAVAHHLVRRPQRPLGRSAACPRCPPGTRRPSRGDDGLDRPVGLGSDGRPVMVAVRRIRVPSADRKCGWEPTGRRTAGRIPRPSGVGGQRGLARAGPPWRSRPPGSPRPLHAGPPARPRWPTCAAGSRNAACTVTASRFPTTSAIR